MVVAFATAAASADPSAVSPPTAQSTLTPAQIGSMDLSTMTPARVQASGAENYTAPDVATAGSTTSESFSAGSTPDTGFHCSGSVCTLVTGKGLHVNYWDTDRAVGSATCTIPYWLLNGVVVHDGYEICGNGPGVFVANWTLNTTYHAGAACNSWVGNGSRSCITIHP